MECVCGVLWSVCVERADSDGSNQACGLYSVPSKISANQPLVRSLTDLLFSFPCGKHQSSEAALRLHVDVDRLLLEKEVDELVLSRFDRLCVHTTKERLTE